MPGAQEIEDRGAITDLALQPQVLHDIGRGERRCCDPGEILCELLVVQELVSRDAHQLEADAHDPGVFDVRRGQRPEPEKRTQAG